MFSQALNEFHPEVLIQAASKASAGDVLEAMNSEKPGFQELALFLSPAATPLLEEMAALAHKKTVKRFGYTISLFSPLYLSNDCINSCAYCSFNKHLKIDLKTLTFEELENECRIIREQGFSHILLVSSENPQKVGLDYLKNSVKIAKKYFQQAMIEVYTLNEESYKALKECGLDGVTLFQETYKKDVYAKFHPAGPKMNFEKRLDTLELAARAGVKKLNLGSLLGLNDFREEALYLAFHANYLKKQYWQTEVAISFPRIRQNTGNFQPPMPVSDAEFVQMILAMRLFDENLSLVLSTRETQEFRNSMVRLGVTSMSAGAKTNPGGYGGNKSESQFKISDERSPKEISDYLKSVGYEVVWKDWEYGI